MDPDSFAVLAPLAGGVVTGVLTLLLRAGVVWLRKRSSESEDMRERSRDLWAAGERTLQILERNLARAEAGADELRDERDRLLDELLDLREKSRALESALAIARQGWRDCHFVAVQLRDICHQHRRDLERLGRPALVPLPPPPPGPGDK